MNETPLLEVVNLGKRFKSRQGVMAAVDNISFAVLRGQHLGVVGASGSGKSTLVKLVQQLLPVTAGHILYSGVDVTGLSERRLRSFRRSVQSVSQNPYSSLFPNKSIGQNIVEPLLIHRLLSPPERLAKAQSLMARVGVPPEHFYAFPHEVSGGQQQRIAIARALALEPELLILDEAVSSLDVSIQAQILRLLAELAAEFDLTYLFVSHNLAVVRLICTQVAVMFLGKIVEIGPTAEIFAQPIHPYTRSLLDAVPDFAADAKDVKSAKDAEDAAQPVVDMPSPYNIPPGCRYQTLCPFATGRCRSESPELRAVRGTQLAACHYGEEIAAQGRDGDQ